MFRQLEFYYVDRTTPICGKEKTVYLTFDDGPIPEVTPWVLEILDKYKIKATFFCVGDNVARNLELYEELRRRGHQTGNHTMNHVQGIKYSIENYIKNVDRANELIDSLLFRPPHGHMRLGQVKALRHRYHIIMWKKYTRNGSIIVFHDSLKAEKNLRWALPRAIEWLFENGYRFKTL